MKFSFIHLYYRHICDFEDDADPQSLEVRLLVHEDHVSSLKDV